VMIRMFPPCPEVFDVRADERKAELQVHHLSDAGMTLNELRYLSCLFFLLRRMACHVCIMSIIYLENIERGGKDTCIHLPRRLQMPGKEKIPSATRCPSSCAAK
jgi:hypothetical protein